MERLGGWSGAWILVTVMVLSLGCASVCAAANGDPKYRITEIGDRSRNLVSFAERRAPLNASGQVAGYADFVESQALHAFLWAPNGNPPRDLGPFDSNGNSNGQSLGYALNNSGQVTGYVYINPESHAFLWKNDGTVMMDLGTLGGSFSEGYDINDSGQVVGDAFTGGDAADHAFLWKNDGHPMRDLGTLGGTSSIAYAINASGQVTGRAYTRGNAAAHAFFWKNDGTTMMDLGTLGGANSSGLLINSAGQVTGVSDIAGGAGSHGFFWRNDGTRMVDLGTLGGPTSAPEAINNAGQITGSAFRRANGVSRRAVIWTNGGARIHDLGTLGGSTSIGHDINNSGWVVGWSRTPQKPGYNLGEAFLWMNDGQAMKDLNDLIDPADPLKPYVVLVSGLAINDAGDVVARGTDSRDIGPYNRQYLLRTSALALVPRALAFGSRRVGTMSAAQAVTVQNNSTSVVAISSIMLEGMGAGQFAQTNNCGSSVVGKGSCTIKVTFQPTSIGAKNATLSVNGGGSGLRAVTLAGTGT